MLLLLPAVNDVRDAVRSVSSYMLFDPDDAVMQQNLVYYRFHRERWHLQEEDFEPRPVRETPPQTPTPWFGHFGGLTWPPLPTLCPGGRALLQPDGRPEEDAGLRQAVPAGRRRGR